MRLLAAVMLMACPAPVAIAPRPPPVTAVTPPPVESPARWTFDGVPFAVLAQHQLADDSIVVVGTHGGRAVVRNGAAHGVSADIYETLVGVVEVGKSFAFVGKSGAIYVSDTALGRITKTRTLPIGTSKFVTVRNAIVAVVNGMLVRSTDGGDSFTPANIPIGVRRIADIVGSERGKVVALTFPQGVFLSTDDGASFQQIPTIGHGVSRVYRDGPDDIYVAAAEGKPLSFRQTMRLNDKNQLVEAAAPGEPKSPPEWPSGASPLTSNARFVGRTLVDVVRSRLDGESASTWKLKTHVLGGAPSHEKLPGLAACEEVNFHATAASLVLACTTPKTVTIFRHRGSKLEQEVGPEPVGAVPDDVRASARRPPSVVGGEGSFLFIASRCPTQTTCTPPRVRLATGGPLRNVELLDAKGKKSMLFAILAVTVIDRTVHALVYAGGHRVELFTGSTDDARWRSRGAFDREAQQWSLEADDDGTLLAAMTNPGSLRVGHVAPNGSPETAKYTEWLSASSFAFVGKRGFATTSRDAWETTDGGLHWKATIGAFGAVRTCGPDGCYVGRGTRIGWDLGHPIEKRVEDAAQPEGIPEVIPPPKRPTGKPIKCGLTGTWKPLMKWDPFANMTPDYERVQLRGGFSIEHAQPAPDVLWAVEVDGKRLSAKATPNGIQLHTGKPLPQPKSPLRPWGCSGSDPDCMDIPGDQPMALGRDVMTKVGTSQVLIRFSEMRSHSDIPVYWSANNFKTVTYADWSLGPLGGANLVNLPSGPALVVWDREVHKASHFAIPLPEDRAPDPPTVVALPIGSALVAPEVVCDKPALAQQHITAWGSSHPVTITGDAEPVEFVTTEATLHFDGSSACVGMYAAGHDGFSALIPLYDPRSSTAFRVHKDEADVSSPGMVEWRPMTCALLPGP